MLYYFHEPKWSDIGNFDKATSSVMASTRQIGAFSVTNYDTDTSAVHFCNTHHYYLDKYFLENTTLTIGYYDNGTNTWKTLVGARAFDQISCTDNITASTTIQVYEATSTATSSAYTGANDCLFVVCVVLYFISFLTWGRFNFLKI
jgi:hypothetical protein